MARLVSSVTLFIFTLQMFCPVVMRPADAAVWGDMDASAPLKEHEVVLEDEQVLDKEAETMRKANVLIMLEATAGMQFTPTTAMPSVVLAGRGAVGSVNKWTESENDGADWGATKSVYKKSVEDVIEMMAGATFGIGAMPVAWSGENLEPARNLYGRDLDDSNNFVGGGVTLSDDIAANKNNYYFPFIGRNGGVPAAYQKQTKPLEIGYANVKPSDTSSEGSHYHLKASEVGTRVTAPYQYSGLNATELPYALVFKNPAHWKEPPSSFTKDDLVPNDSRLYQAKLVLWNLMDNQEMWSNIRFGLASTFLPHTNYKIKVSTANPFGHHGLTERYDFHGMYKVSPFGANAHTFNIFKKDGAGNLTHDVLHWNKKSNNQDGRWKFKHGILTQSISGNVRGLNALHGQMYPMWQHYTNEIIYTRIPQTQGSNAPEMAALFKAFRRASLQLPIAEYEREWSATGRPTMKHADRFRMWIDGFADLANSRTSQWHYYKNPEIGVAGDFVLPHAIYPDPRTHSGTVSLGMTHVNHYRKNVFTEGTTSNAAGRETAVWYSHKDKQTDYSYTKFPSSTQLENPEAAPRSLFNAGSGEAVGSVLDFFSPPKDKYKNHLIPDQYPIRSTCENNWVILITTGQEVRPEDDTTYTYTAAQAIRNLYDATNKETKAVGRATTSGHLDFRDKPDGTKTIYAPYEQMTMLPRKPDGTPLDTKISEVDLDFPVRTLVVGMIPDPNSLPAGAVRDEVMDMRLNLTRMAVAGRGGDPGAVTLANMYDADFQPFLAYNTATLMQAITDAMVTINDSSVVQPAKGTVAQAKSVNISDETSDLFTYDYRILRSNQWEAELKRYVASTNEAGDVVIDHQWTIGKRPSPADRNVVYWKPSSLASPLTPLLEGDTDFRNTTALISGDRIIPPAETEFGGVSPSAAFVKWLKGMDYSYMNKKSYERSHLTTDFGQGGMIVVQNPATSVDFLPGYREWAGSLTPAANVLYGQTNDGLLHLVNQESGSELKAIVPPPSLLPGRLAALTTRQYDSETRQWISILGPESNGGYRSVPVYTLDGALQRRDFDLTQSGAASGWGSYLLGALGRGGSGLYMLNVSDHTTPSFMWYKERVGDYLVRTNASGNALEAVTPSGTDPDKELMKLGFNSPKPVMGVARYKSGADTKLQNFIAVGGGTQMRRDLDNNGKDGAALLIMDPKNGEVIKSFTGDSLDAGWRFGLGLTGKVPYMGMMVSQTALLRASLLSDDNLGPYLVGSMLTADNQGNIFRIDMEDDEGKPLPKSGWGIKTIATLRSVDDIASGNPKSYSMPHGVVLANHKGYTWLAGGNADIQVIKEKTEDYEEGYIRNDKQMIFAFRTGKGQSAPYTRDKFKAIGDDPDSSYQAAADTAYEGWHLPLRGADVTHFREYVSTKPVLIGGTLYVATFIGKDKQKVEDSSVCSTTRLYDGDSRLFAIDVTTGLGNTWNGDAGKIPKYVEFKGTKIVSLTDMEAGGRNKLLIDFDILNEVNNNIAQIKAEQPKLRNVLSAEDNKPVPNMATVDENVSGGAGGKFPPGIRLLNYWIKE